MNRVIIHAGGAYVSGMEIVLLDLMKYLKLAGWEPYAVVSGWNNGDYIARLSSSNVSFFCLKLGAVLYNPFTTPLKHNIEGLRRAPGALYDLRKFVKSIRPDAIVQTSFRSAFVSMPFTFDVCSNHFLYLHENAGCSIGSFRGRRVADKCRGIVCVSEYVAAGIRPHVHDPRKVIVVPNGVSLPEADTSVAGARHYSEDDKLRISIVGQIIERKNHRLVFKALEKLLSKSKNVILNVFGDCSTKYAKDLRAELTKIPYVNEAVRWFGFEPNREKIYAQSDVIVTASLDEPFGMTALEAGAWAKPILAPATCAFPEIVEHGVTGLLFSPDDADALAAAIEALRPSGIRMRMGEANRARVAAEFSVERMGNAFIDALVASIK